LALDYGYQSNTEMRARARVLLGTPLGSGFLNLHRHRHLIFPGYKIRGLNRKPADTFFGNGTFDGIFKNQRMET
jgi:hypothetical protein